MVILTETTENGTDGRRGPDYILNRDVHICIRGEVLAKNGIERTNTMARRVIVREIEFALLR